ncbi:class II fructose-bisphosphatase [Desulfohalovibrio reitneri]|uniref:class II fructose-bisphosphatase n=1 Tax=Desulfohalovibrio reitneri TaxID=1307759 RepID=UPI0004A7769B|nr:class II fructose-bisphosphatase [Desulfohalovibrio reitneri]
MEVPSKNLALDLTRVTEAASLASARWLGRGDKNSGDKAAVDAMRKSFSSLDIDGTVIIGEGEKDEAPMLYNGEQLGTGNGPRVDVAVDPVEGTRLLAYGRPNAISVVGVAPANTMFNPGPSYYMKKLVVPEAASGVIDIDAPAGENLTKIAKAMDKDVDDLTVFVLDKPRHAKLIDEIREVGARIALFTDGDITGSLMAVDPHSDIDVMMGTGGTPEGVLSAIAIRIMGGSMQAKLDPQGGGEKTALINAGIDTRHVLTEKELVKSDDLFFAATGISGGSFLHGVKFTGKGAVTHSMSMRGLTGTIRYMEAVHNFRTLMKVSAVPYD